MRIIYFGDVVGRSGRQAVLEILPTLRDRLNPDLVLLNGENAAAGFGITTKICKEFYAAGIDGILLGNHAFNNADIFTSIDTDTRLIRPLNYPPLTPGRGHQVFTTAQGQDILVLQVMGRVFMEPLDNPFTAIETTIAPYVMTKNVAAIFVDVHAEATSKKKAIAHQFDGRTTCAIGTHTHAPTADAQILKRGTGYLSDVGMCGDYDSILGMTPEPILQKLQYKFPKERFSVTEGPGTVCAVVVDVNPKGLTQKIMPLRIGPHLDNTPWEVFS